MGDREALLSAMMDQAIASEMVPWACPCLFGPEGRYRLEELVGVGAHALVYRATDRMLSSEGFDAQVAVKIVRVSGLARDEALAARRVTHPSVLAIVDRGVTAEGDAYIVSEYVDGGDLQDLALPMRPREAAALVARIARGVQAAHSVGIVHCDIKPSNILLTRTGEPKLCDFGLSRWQQDEQGAIRGNAAFMSPEQFAGSDEALSPPSDIYALGGLLYNLLTGSLPHGATHGEVARHHAERSDPPAPGVERDLDRICLRAMAPERDGRHHSAGELADDLERWLKREPIPWTRPSAARRLRLWTARRPVRALLVVVVAATVVAGGSVWRYNVVRDQERRELIEAEAKRAQAEALRDAEAQLEAIKARARRQIEEFARSLYGNPIADPNSGILPGLVWTEWMGGGPVLNEAGALAAPEERAMLLKEHIKRTREAGPERLDTLLSAYALCQLLLSMGEHEEAAPHLALLETELAPKLGEDDPLRLCLAGLRACIAVLDARTADEQAKADQALAEIDLRLMLQVGTDPTRSVIARVQQNALRTRKPTP